MGKNIVTKISGIKDNQTQTPETRALAKKLEKYVGTDKAIPKKLAMEIKNNPSTSDAMKTMKSYVNKK